MSMVKNMQQVTLPKERIGDDGRIRVWDIPSGRWVRRYAVDVREQITMKTASVTGPTVEMVGPGGRFLCCPEEVPQYLARMDFAYHRVDTPAVTESTSESESKSGSELKSESLVGSEYDFEAHTVQELRECMSYLNLDSGVGARRSEMIAALNALEETQRRTAIDFLLNNKKSY